MKLTKSDPAYRATPVQYIPPWSPGLWLGQSKTRFFRMDKHPIVFAYQVGVVRLWWLCQVWWCFQLFAKDTFGAYCEVIVLVHLNSKIFEPLLLCLSRRFKWSVGELNCCCWSWFPGNANVRLWRIEWWIGNVGSVSAGWWFQPLWKILVSWDDYSQYMGVVQNTFSRTALNRSANRVATAVPQWAIAEGFVLRWSDHLHKI